MDATLLSTAQLAELLSVSMETVRWWRKQGRGPRAVKIGRLVRYPSSEVERWLEEHIETGVA